MKRLSDRALIDAAVARAEREEMGVAEAARRMRVSKSTARRWIKKGGRSKLRGDNRENLEAFVERREGAMASSQNGVLPDSFQAGKTYAIAHMRGYLAGLESQQPPSLNRSTATGLPLTDEAADRSVEGAKNAHVQKQMTPSTSTSPAGRPKRKRRKPGASGES
jgi:transposase-like protein